MVEHFLGKEEVPSSILGNSSKQQREGETFVSPFFVAIGLGARSHKPVAIKKEEGDTRCRPFSLFALKAPAAAQEERQAKRSQSSGMAPAAAQEEKDAEWRINPREWRPCGSRRGKGRRMVSQSSEAAQEERQAKRSQSSGMALAAAQEEKDAEWRINPRQRRPRRQ